MKLFFKHLLRSVIKKPLQPIILVFTMILAIAVSIFSFSIREGLNEEVALKQAAEYGNAHITVTLNSTSQSRFMFAEDVESILSGKGEAAGCFELPLLMGEEKQTVFGVATNFYEIGSVFDLSFYEYGKITPSTVGTSAFVTKEFAQKNGLSLGDTFLVTAFGEEKTYTVSALSQSRFLGNYDVMVDITSIVRSLAEESLLLSALGDRFKPCSTIYIKVNEGVDVIECMELLREDKDFADKNINEIAEAIKRESNLTSLDSVIDVSVLLSLLLAVAVTFCCFYILAAERAEENYSFTLSGAKPWRLYFLQYAEIFIYWLIGTILGTLLAGPLVKFLFSYVGFRYASFTISVATVVKSGLFLLLAAFATATLFIVTQRLKKQSYSEKRVEKKVVLICTIATVCICIFNFIAPMGWRFPLYLISTIAIFLLNFIAGPFLLKWLTGKMNAAFDKEFENSYPCKKIGFHYAVKNLHSVKILHNISRLMAILVCVVLTTSFIIASAFGNLEYTKEFFDADYAILNATERCTEKVEQCESVDSVYKVFMRNTVDGGLFSANDAEAFADDLKVTRLPKGNQAVVTYGEAKRLSLKVGDVFTVEVEGQKLDLEVCEIIHPGISFILFDCEHFGIAYNMLMAKGAEGALKSEVLGELAEKTSLELAAVIAVDTLYQNKLETANICLNLGLVSLITIVVFSLIGMLDNLHESYRARRDEFELYHFSGMSKKTIRRMKAWEIFLTMMFGVLLGLAFFLPAILLANASFNSFGYSTFYNFLKFIR